MEGHLVLIICLEPLKTMGVLVSFRRALSSGWGYHITSDMPMLNENYLVNREDGGAFGGLLSQGIIPCLKATATAWARSLAASFRMMEIT